MSGHRRVSQSKGADLFRAFARPTSVGISARSTPTSRGKRLLKTRPVAAVEFYLVAQLVDLDPEAVELDLVLPIVAGWHRFGALRMAGLDELEEHTQSLDEPGAPRYRLTAFQAGER
jgi:hypothetical protein